MKCPIFNIFLLFCLILGKNLYTNEYVAIKLVSPLQLHFNTLLITTAVHEYSFKKPFDCFHFRGEKSNFFYIDMHQSIG